MKGRIMSIEKILNFAQHNPEQFILLLLIGFFFMWSQFTRSNAVNKRNNSRQKRAQNPRIPREFLKAIPEGFVIGTAGSLKKKYFCIPEKGSNMIHAIVFGGSGSGKSSGPIISSMLANLEREKHGEQAFTYVAVDIKGELHSMLPRDSYLLIDPTDRENSVGWDPYYLLNQNQLESLDQDLVIRVFSNIASSFIPSGNPEAAFFSSNAKSLLAGLLCWGYFKGIGMVDMVQKILTSNVTDLLKECLADCDEDSVAYSWLGKFQGDKLQSSEAFQNFVSEMCTQLSCFKLSSVQYILRDNLNKIGPDAVRKKNVFLAVPDTMLTEEQFSPIFRMILEQEMQYLTEKEPEKGTKPVGLILDEAYKLGGESKGHGLELLPGYLSYARSFLSFVWISFQGKSQIEQQYGREGCRVIMDNTRCKIFLESSDIPTINDAVELCGKFYDRESNVNTDKLQTSLSWREKNIFEKSDFPTLAARGRVIVILQMGKNTFYNVKKLQWFKDKYLTHIHDIYSDKTK